MFLFKGKVREITFIHTFISLISMILKHYKQKVTTLCDIWGENLKYFSNSPATTTNILLVYIHCTRAITKIIVKHDSVDMLFTCEILRFTIVKLFYLFFIVHIHCFNRNKYNYNFLNMTFIKKTNHCFLRCGLTWTALAKQCHTGSI